MTHSPPIYSIVIVEDHNLVRDSLAAMVERHPQLELVGQAADGQSAISLIEKTKPDVAIVDFAMPDMTGLEVITKTRELQSVTRYLILTGSPMDDEEREHLSKLAEGFMHKETGRDALLDMIIDTANRPHLSPAKINTLDDNVGIINAGVLTKRERAVLREIARGYSVEQIADGLSISPSTVRKHRENIMRKLKLNSTAQLVRASMQIGQF